jgi:hypothetical protein
VVEALTVEAQILVPVARHVICSALLRFFKRNCCGIKVFLSVVSP